MDVVIVYERKQRELENSILLQVELEKRGLTCEIVQFYEAPKFNLLNINPPKVVVVPHLYNTKSLYRTLARFGQAKYIVNMQYEQVLSKKWEDLGAHTPKGEACKGVHICWGESVASRLGNAGVPPKNINIIAPLHLDLLKPEYLESGMKWQLAKEFGISAKKRWVLFISSFTYADIDPSRLKLNENAAGTSLSDFPGIHTKSRNEILNWLRGVLEKDNETMLIYRPHPDELSLDAVWKLQEEFDNFKVFRGRAVKDWINASDVLYTWYSTSIVEAHFMDRPYSILRPFELPDSFDSVLLKHGEYIRRQQDFELDYLGMKVSSEKAIPDHYMNRYYKIDSASPSFSLLGGLISSFVESQNDLELANRNSSLWFKSKVISVLTACIYLLNRLRPKKLCPIGKKGGLLFQLFSEMDTQIASSKEKEGVRSNILRVLRDASEKHN